MSSAQIERSEAQMQEHPECLTLCVVAGNAYHGIGVPDCARMGKQAAEEIVSSARVVW